MKNKNGIYILLFAVCLITVFGFEANRANAFSYYNEDYYDDNAEEQDENQVTNVNNLSFTIQKTKYNYSGNYISPVVTVRGTTNLGNVITLVKDVDYTVTYENNKNCGVARIIVQGKGKYSGYHILKFGIVPTSKVTKVKVKSPYYMENTVTFKKVNGASGYYVYRKQSGGQYKFVANITDPEYEVFHDRHKSLKANKTYYYKIVAYVADKYPGERNDGFIYSKPDYLDYLDSESITSYYGLYDNMYYSWYNYSCVKDKCILSFESDKYATAKGKVTKKISSKKISIYTGDATTDYMAYLTNKKIVKKKMSTDQRVKAIFNWMVKNCDFTKNVKDYKKLKKMKCYYKYTSKSFKKKAQAYENKIMKQIRSGNALCIGTYWHDFERAGIAFAYRKGSCSFLTPMFNILCNQAGVEAYIVDGYYVNKDKSKDYHNFCFVKIGKTYYWYDVPVACKNKKAKNSWYKKGTKEFKKCHSFSKDSIKGYKTAKFKK